MMNIIMNNLEKTLKALANRRRLTILKYLKNNKEASVMEIARAIHLSFKSTSRHLGTLKAANILERDQRGLQMFYYISKDLDSSARHVVSTF